MSKKPVKTAAAEPNPITLIVTIYPPKKGVRHVMVSGAPDGEMPLLIAGIFQDRHALLDQAFAGVLKREPQIVTLKDDKPGKSKSIAASADDDDESTETSVTESEPTDQLVTDAELPSPVGEGQGEGESVPVSPITSTDELPEIDGDTGDLAESRQRFEAALEEIKADQAATEEDEDNG